MRDQTTVTRATVFRAALVVLTLSAATMIASFTVSASGNRVNRLPVFVDSTHTPSWPRNVASAPGIPDFALVDQNSRAISARDLDGRITVLTFFYASCDSICPLLHAQLRNARTSIADTSHVRFVSVSLTPERDSPAQLTMFAEHQHLPSGWTLLTGARDQVDRVLGAPVYALSAFAKRTVKAHGEAAYLIDGHRRVRGVYHGTQAADVEQLVRDIATLEATLQAERGGQ